MEAWILHYKGLDLFVSDAAASLMNTGCCPKLLSEVSLIVLNQPPIFAKDILCGQNLLFQLHDILFILSIVLPIQILVASFATASTRRPIDDTNSSDSGEVESEAGLMATGTATSTGQMLMLDVP